MTVHTPAAKSAFLPPHRAAKEIIRRYRLRRGARVLDIGGGQGEVVLRLRACGMRAFGLFDGPAPPRDPSATHAEGDDVPAIQPAVLHQNVPFLAQSFDCVLLRGSDVYQGSLTSPEACTATANLLAALQPGKPLVCCGTCSGDAMASHLSAFPGDAQDITLGTGGFANMLGGLVGRRMTASAIQFVIPSEPISRLEWHRLARRAVMAFQQSAA